jgi:hypothetical protein
MSSPLIQRHAWGRLHVAGRERMRDGKLFPGGARPWDWRETGTRHSPGVQRADVAELLEHGATTLVLSRGVDLMLRVPPELVEWLEDQGLTVHVLQTDLAVARYNALSQAGEAVGALVHTTC